MTNFDTIMQIANEDNKHQVIECLTNNMVTICINIINQLNREQNEHIEISNFDIAEMESKFRSFFNKENTKWKDKNNDSND